MSRSSRFTGSIPQNYERYLGPVLFEPYAQELAARIGAFPGSLLELACGTGRLTAQLIKKLAPQGRLLATDLNEDMLLVAARLIQDPRLSWRMADAAELPFDDRSFDLAACQFGVAFFPEPLEAYHEVFRVLRPGGLFLFNTWDDLAHNPRAALIGQVLDRILGPGNHAFREKGPYSYHDASRIREELATAGFTATRIDTVALESRFDDAWDFLTGFIEGSTLAPFLRSQAPEVEQAIRRELAREMNDIDQVLGDRVPMRALVVETVRPDE